MTAALDHCAFLYRDEREWLDGVCAFVAPALSAGEPVMVAAAARRHPLLRERLARHAEAVNLVDMGELANPARLIPTYREAAMRAGGEMYLVAEPGWPGRTADEMAEVILHEALVNRAFAGARIRILCPYDVSELSPEVIEAAHRTHPCVVAGGRRMAGRYSTDSECEAFRQPLPEAPGHATRIRFTLDGLTRVRAAAAELAARAGLDAGRRGDLTVAVNELATNSVRHGGGAGELRAWTVDGEVLCEIHDGGRITDPLTGRRNPQPASPDGRGLWLVNQLCDLVQLRSSHLGTTVRVRMAAGPAG